MKTILYKANERGTADYGWLKANYSFSFANHYDPSKVHFGMLRVLNDDTIAPGRGFDTHPHDNMEIITIPLLGSVGHKDSTGGVGVIGPGEVQVMSAGSGLQHSEYNASTTDFLNLFQIWIFPKERNIEPRYDQKVYPKEDRINKFQILASPVKSNDYLWINQDAFLSLGNFDANKSVTYKLNINTNGVYIMVINGSIKVVGETLERRDAIGIYESSEIEIEMLKDTELLVIEVPMK